MKTAYLLVLAFFAVSSAEVATFNDYQVHKVTPKTPEQVLALLAWEETPRGYDFWGGASKVNAPAFVMVPPHLRQDFRDTVSLIGAESELYISDVQKLIENEKMGTRDARFGWGGYYTLTEINNWMFDLAAQYPTNVRVVRGGQTYENRDILGVHISYSSANANRIVFIEGGIHAREWISPATVTYLINELVTSSNSTIRSIAESFDWYLFPVLNPDGYVFTHTNNRLWRKTRAPYGTCFGADPNRNWGYRWNTGGASSQPCSETYAGPNAFSERETNSVANSLMSIGENLYAYISFHSYSQILLIPYGHTTAPLDNYDELMRIGRSALTALASRYNTQYTLGNVAEAIYVATGSSVDWVKAMFGTRITYTYELRDRGQTGFILPPEQIIPNCLEVVDSLIAMFREAATIDGLETEF